MLLCSLNDSCASIQILCFLKIYVFQGEFRERFLCDLKLLGIIWKYMEIFNANKNTLHPLKENKKEWMKEMILVESFLPWQAK